MLWFNKNDRRAAFCDRRREKHILCDGRFFEVNPDTVCDFRKLPFPDESFFLICFDPPHLLQAGETSWIKKKYGSLNRLTWSEDLSKGFDECWRVLKPGGTLIFKWNETQIAASRIIKIFGVNPLFGHKSGKNSKTAMGHLGVSQSELAKYLKSRGRTSELLTGKRCPSKAEIAILRELLGLSADILIPRVHLEEACPKN